MTSSSERRAEVLELRIRLERSAAIAFDRTCRPVVTGWQSDIVSRLTFLVALVDEADQLEVYRLARLGGRVYVLTSDVLHGRVRALDLGGALIAEWKGVVDRIERVLANCPS